MELGSGRPMELTKVDNLPLSISEEQRLFGKAVGSTIRPYIEAARKLLNGKYSGILEQAPLHLRQPSMIVVFCCKDGVIIRYDCQADVDRPRVGIAYTEETLTEFAFKVSESVIHCFSTEADIPSVPANGPEITFTSTSATTGETKKLVSFKVNYNIVIKEPTGDLLPPPSKPYCLFSVRNEIEIMTEMELVSDGGSLGTGDRFLSRTPLRLPVGWQCIEIYPITDVSFWDSEFAYMWAENDILASVVAANQREANFTTLDPNAAVRKQLSDLLDKYKSLLDSKPQKEEILQEFLKQHPELLCPAKINMWPKLDIGPYETDFVFKEASGDYLLIELEKSIDPLFIQSGDRSSELKHAQDQITNWKRYIADNLSTVRRELKLTNISSNPRSLIVIGRSEGLSGENRQHLQTLENDSPKNKIMTYDDLYENTKAIIENLFGRLWIGEGNTQIYALSGK